MHGPPLVGWLLVALAAGTAALCLLRARAGDSTGWCARRTAGAEAVHSLGMALMAVPVAMPGQGTWKVPLLIALYSALILRTLLFAHGECHRAHHTVEAAAMLYMAAAMTTAPGPMDTGSMAGIDHGTMGVPAVNTLLLGYFAIYMLWAGARITTVPPVNAAGAGSADAVGTTFPTMMHAPEVGNACRVSLAVAMFVMTLMM
ncbi:DUF5134 domain-containing protein [Streptomyces halobius]|uniref:DUF5134 domain-containing protein n=1 Tax=Streptomyces halobius TaxID=2879846 RepID=A0ABY4M4I9_9ACTN|nr:DUF5134 domain-containing protein [Streptomyces halobius]UQA91151.1 DUF5134 domain-containing protein [Streptomyces halobius]